MQLWAIYDVIVLDDNLYYLLIALNTFTKESLIIIIMSIPNLITFRVEWKGTFYDVLIAAHIVSHTSLYLLHLKLMVGISNQVKEGLLAREMMEVYVLIY